MSFLCVYNGLTIYPAQRVRDVCDKKDVCACVASCIMCVCVCMRVMEYEYWLGGIVLSRGHLSPAGPLALQLFRMCHRSVSQTGTHTSTHVHTHMHTKGLSAMTVADKSSLTLEVKRGSAASHLLIW